MIKQKGAFSSFIIRLAIVATGLSVAVMIVTLAIVAGFRYAISEKLFGFMGHAQVRTFNETESSSFGGLGAIYADPALFSRLRNTEHVVLAAPFIIKPVIAQANGLLEGLKLKGVDKQYRFSNGITTSGKQIDFSDSAYSKDIVLSKSTADRMNVRIGDTVQVNFIDEKGARIRRLRVRGMYHSGMEEIDKMFAICDIRLLQRINNWPADSINGYELTLDDPANADTVESYVFYNLISPPVAVYTTTKSETFIFDWLNIQGVNSAVLIIIMTIVAIINLGAALLILIVDRAVMIGLLKALGMPYSTMRNIFLSIAAIVGGAGVVLGNILALGLCFLQLRYGLIKLPEASYSMRYAPVKIIWWQVAAVDVGTLVLCVLCMWLPTLYIRRVQPARVLQFK